MGSESPLVVSRGWLVRVALVLLVLAGMPALLRAQADYSAARTEDLQVGGSFSFGRSNYLPWDTQGNPAPLSDLTRTVKLTGFGGYATLDVRPHYGVEVNIRHLSGADNGGNQTSYEIGGRYIVVRTRRFMPYGRVSFGRGVYDYPSSVATLSFNLYSLGGGVDYHLRRGLNLRADYEWQSWMNVPLRNPSPQVVSIGVAYHFH